MQYAQAANAAAMRHEAIVGLGNLLKSRSTHGAMLEARLLPDLLQLVRTCAANSMRPAAYAVACLCANEAMAPEMLDAGFVPQLLYMQAKTVDFIVRRHAAHARTAASVRAYPDSTRTDFPYPRAPPSTRHDPPGVHSTHPGVST